MNKQIREIILNNKVLCAPLCGFTDFAFREILASYNPAIVFTEMLSAQGLFYNYEKTIRLYKDTLSDVLLGVQLFGNDINSFKNAVHAINRLKFAVLDINAGCSVKKVLKTGSGCALMDDPTLIYNIIKNVKSITDKPVTMKMRKGYNNENFLECALAAQEAGVEWITLHARTSRQKFSGEVDFNAIKELKLKLDIPVVGNGEIWRPEDVKIMMDETNCDAIMLARGLLGKPWLIKQCHDYIKTGKYTIPEKSEIKSILLKHLDYMVKDKGEKLGIKEFRKHIVKYSKGIIGSRDFRKYAVHIEQEKVLYEEINNLFDNEEVLLETG